MTAEASSPDRLKWVASDLMLGFLVTALSVFTAMANYATYQVGGSASDHEAQADRLLADSNAQSIRATQYIVVDFSMYDGYYVNLDLDDFKADYYQSQFSAELQASVDRNSPFDDQYYDAMYTEADDMFNEAFERFDQASAGYQRGCAMTSARNAKKGGRTSRIS